MCVCVCVCVLCTQVFPEYEEAEAIECILEEGDVVYIPSKWPHYVECLTPSVPLPSKPVA